MCALEDEDGNTFVSCWHAADNTGGVHILIPAHIQRAAPLTTDLVVQLDGCRLEMAMGRMHVLPTRYALLAVDGTAHATLSKLLLASVPHCISDDVCVPWAPRLLR